MTEKIDWNGRRTSEAYALYPANVSNEDIREAFMVKYGIEPVEIKRTAGGVLAGPLPKPEERTEDV